MDDCLGGGCTCEPGHAGADVSCSHFLTRAFILTGIQEALVENLNY